VKQGVEIAGGECIEQALDRVSGTVLH